MSQDNCIYLNNAGAIQNNSIAAPKYGSFFVIGIKAV